VDDWSLGVDVLVLVLHLRALGKVSLRLEVILDLVADWPGWAEVSVVGLDLGRLLEAALGFQVVLEGGHDVGAAGGLGLERPLRLSLVGQGGGCQTQAGWATEVGAGLASMTEQLHFWGPVVGVPVVGQEGGGSGDVGAGTTGHL